MGHGVGVVGRLSDGGDLQLGHVTAEALGLVEALAALELEGHALRAAELVYNLRSDRATFDEGRADRHGLAFAAEQNLAEGDFGIDFGIEFLDVEGVACLDAVLFTACFDYCVGHGRVGKSLSASGRAGNPPRYHPACKDFLNQIRENRDQPSFGGVITNTRSMPFLENSSQ